VQNRYRFAGLLPVFSAIVGFVALLYAPRTLAIPAWSRRYGVQCSMCHSFPSLQLNAEGLDFFRRGHRFSGDTADKEFTHFLSGHVEWEYDLTQGQPTAFQSPAFHLHAGGSFSSVFSAYLDANVNKDFEVIYLQATKEFAKDTFVTLRGGKISPSLIRNYGNGLMASASTPLVLTDTTLDVNPFTPARDSFGVDVGARWKNLFVQGGVVNGEDVPGQAQVMNHKDFYATGEVALPDGISGAGVYYYRGGYDLGDPNVQVLFDQYDRFGVFANYTHGPVRLAGAYLTGTDRVNTLSDRKIRGFYAQVDVQPAGWLVPFGRYEEVRTEVEDETSLTKKATIGSAIRLYEGEMTGGRLVLEGFRRNDAGTWTTGGVFFILWGF
jgi:hypothetical protein